jgi:hypothetical protein
MPEPDPATSAAAQEHARRAQEKLGELNRELDATPPRKLYRPTKKAAGISFGSLLIIVAVVLRFALLSGHHRPDDSAYLNCIGLAQATNGAVGTGTTLAQAEDVCNKYPH